MAITPRPSNTIVLSPAHQVEEQTENRYRTSAAAKPGTWAEMHDDSGELKWRPAASATESSTLAIYMENGLMNRGIDDDWAANDLCRVFLPRVGDIMNALLPSGQNMSYGEKCQIGAGGTTITASDTTAAANVARLQSLDAPGAVSVTTRFRVQVIN